MAQLYGIDVYDTILGVNRVNHIRATGEVIIDDISRFEFESRIFNGTAVNPPIGSIIEPARTVKFFESTNSMHYIYTHNSNDVTSVKKSVRAVMPTDFITEPHWIILYCRQEHIGQGGGLIVSNFFVATPVSSSIDTTYQNFIFLLRKLFDRYGTDAIYIFILQYTVVIRREL